MRIDSLVKTQTVQIVQQAYSVEEPDIQVLYPMAQKAMGTGMYCSEPAIHAVQAEALTASGSRCVGFALDNAKNDAKWRSEALFWVLCLKTFLLVNVLLKNGALEGGQGLHELLGTHPQFVCEFLQV